MKRKCQNVGKVFILLALGVLTLGTQAAWVGSVTFDLVCVLNDKDNPCTPQVGSFGTVTIVDSGDNAALLATQVEVTVDLLNVGLKFRDLMLNYSGVATSITGTGILLDPAAYSIEPYAGLFDVGGTELEGWTGDSGNSFVLTGNSNLSASAFNVLDSLGNVNVALHIQSIGPGGCSGNDDGTTDCVPGQTGQGSLKIGGIEGGRPTEEIPEPSTTVLLGGGLVALLWAYRRRKQA